MGELQSRRVGRQGGAGTSGGIDFQARLGAWVATAILAETSAAPPWAWPSDSTVESLEVETREEVDDLRVANSGGSSAFIQAKLKLSLSALPSSDFAKAVAAFVRQYLGDGSESASFGADDRLVLAVGVHSSGLIKEDLPRLLERSRGLQRDRALDSIAGSESDRKVLQALLGHIRSAWRGATGSDPSDQDLRQLLTRIWISVFDLSDEGSDARVAQERLRSVVLADPSQEAQTWSILVSLIAGFGATQSGADRQRLQDLLSGKGVELRATPSYREDISRLRDYSAGISRRLQPLSRIALPGDNGEIKLKRLVPDVVLDVTTAGSLLITGDPGVGKSASVFELVSSLENEGRDVLVFAADALDANSLGQLRDELGLEHELADVLRNWPGAESGTLVVDGLDAARGEGTQDALLDLIAATLVTAKRWNVVASVRRFDLRYNHKLKQLFSAEPILVLPEGFTSIEFEGIRHLIVPDLSDDELAQLVELAPALGTFLEAAPKDLRDLARVPFNLRLLAELVRLDVDPAELEPITTQVQLLDKYWEHRVIGSDRDGDARRHLIAEVVREMVANRRLQANRRTVVGADSGSALNHLLSEHVLSEQQSGGGGVEDEIITFSHHVLFDYAIDRALLRGTDDARIEAILANPDLLVFARPSFDLHFRHLWEADASRRRFWNASLELASAKEVPQIGRIVAPVVAADLVRDAEEVKPLLDELADPIKERRVAAEDTLRHMIGAATSSEPKAYLRSQAQLSAWTELSAALADAELNRQTAFSLRQLVWPLSDDVDSLDPFQRANLGRAARRLLGYAFEQPVSERGFTWPGIAAVAATYESDPARSRYLLSRILESERLEQFGYLEMPDLANQIELLIGCDPGFVRDIYAAAFAFEETSKETTEMGGGRVLRLTSHRSQDYSSAHYSLAQAFPRFLQAAPLEALEALVAVRIAYAHKRFSKAAMKAIAIQWTDQEVRMLTDGTSVWDREPLGHDDEVKILDSFESRLDELAGHDGHELADLISLVASLEAPVSIWRRVLIAGARCPERFLPLVMPLLVSPQTLEIKGLTEPVGDFLAASFADYPQDVRAQIETTIFGMADHFVAANPDLGEHAVELGERLRDRLLGCLPIDQVTDPSVKAHLQAKIDAKDVPTNLEPGVFSEWGSSEYGERDYLAEVGVDVDTEPNRRIQALIVPVHEFAKDHLNGSPSLTEIEGVLPALEELWDALRTWPSDGVDERQADQGIGYAAEAAEAISRGEGGGQVVPGLDLVIEILRAAARHRKPAHDPDRDDHFDEHPSWGSPAPRIEAAGGLTALASNQEYASQEILQEIQHLSQDPDPAVRFHVARRLPLLEETASDLMWAIAERIAAQESSRAVTDAMLGGLPAMTREDPAKRRMVAESLYARTPTEGPGAQRLRSTCVEILTDLYVGEGDEEARDFIQREVLGDLARNDDAARNLIFRLRTALVFGDDEPRATNIRARAIGLVDDSLRHAIEQYDLISRRLATKTEAPAEDDDDLKKGRNVAQVIDTVAAEIYFASGAFMGGNNEPRATPEQRARLYREARDLLDRLSGVPLPPVTHHLLETLEACIEFDPRGVFHLIDKTIEGGKGGQYQLDSLAANLFVSIVERYLAEYRTLFQRYDDMRGSLIKMLDLFVDAGWPKARQLTYGLHELFR